jgi:hypothetical protein
VIEYVARTISSTGSTTVTLQEAVLLFSLDLTVITASPQATALMRPLSVTVTTFSSDDENVYPFSVAFEGLIVAVS